VDLEDESIESESIQTAAEINSLLFGYALTIHKSQGSQWKKVYVILHNSHNRNLQRELLYTAITRAQKELYVICEPESFIQGVTSQHIIGNTLEEKAKFFIAKAEEAKKRKDLFDNGTSNKAALHVNVEETKYENGQIFDEDTGQQLGQLADNLYDEVATELIPIQTIPATLSVFLNNSWYVYKLDSRYKHEDSIIKTEIVEPNADLVKDL
jgi:hypothetical protein